MGGENVAKSSQPFQTEDAVLIILACAVGGLIYCWCEGQDIGERLWGSLMGAMIGGVAGLFLAAMVGGPLPKKVVKTEEIALVSVRNPVGPYGELFLGTGVIETSEWYFYYTPSGAGHKPGKLLASDRVTVYEEDRKDGVLEKYETVLARPAHRLLGLVAGNTAQYAFRIPKGSLKREFVIQ